MRDEITVASVKAAPPVAVATTHFIFGIQLNEWVSICTIAYIVLQAIFLIRNQIRKGREDK